MSASGNMQNFFNLNLSRSPGHRSKVEAMTHTYTNIPNFIIQCKPLSFGATGLLCYMISMPSDWKFNLKDLSQRKKDKRTGTRNYLAELETLGIVQKQRLIDKQGRVKSWSFQLNPDSGFQLLDINPDSGFQIVDNRPILDVKPDSGFPDVVISTCGKSDATNNTEEQIKQKNKENREDCPQKPKSFKTYSPEEFKNEVATSAQEKGMPKSMMSEFLNYWTEKSATGRMKFQLQATWETGKRIGTWISNQEKFGSRGINHNNGLQLGQKYHQEGDEPAWNKL